jgi:hypothetical protein
VGPPNPGLEPPLEPELEPLAAASSPSVGAPAPPVESSPETLFLFPHPTDIHKKTVAASPNIATKGLRFCVIATSSSK